MIINVYRKADFWVIKQESTTELYGYVGTMGPEGSLCITENIIDAELFASEQHALDFMKGDYWRHMWLTPPPGANVNYVIDPNIPTEYRVAGYTLEEFSEASNKQHGEAQ